MIPTEAVEALAAVLAQEALVSADMDGHGWDAENDDPAPFMPRARERARTYLEAAAPILLSHEREQTRLAHLDAMVNRGTASRLEQAITGVLELAAPQRHMVSAAEIREWIARALEPTE